MRNIIMKEFLLSASPVTYWFLAAGLMFMLPGYPVLCAALFTTLGIFQSFQYAREANDCVYSALLPVAKTDVVKGRFAFVCIIELASFAIMAACALIRMTVLRDSEVYRSNALMNANGFALGAALVIFALFNLIFAAGWFKTCSKFTKPFVLYIIAAFAVVFACEALHFIPGLGAVNAFGFEHAGLQLILLLTGACVYAAVTFVSLKLACARFEKIDL